MIRTLANLAQVAKLVDALASGASGGNPVEVQVLSWAPLRYQLIHTIQILTDISSSETQCF